MVIISRTMRWVGHVVGNLNLRGHLGDLGVDGRIILNRC